MASEFDEALQTFLWKENLKLLITHGPGDAQGFPHGFYAYLQSQTTGENEGHGEGASLDDAVNQAVDNFTVVHDRAAVYLGRNAEQCPCESEACERARRHRAGECPHQADPELQVEYLGALCPACYEQMPEEYRKR